MDLNLGHFSIPLCCVMPVSDEEAGAVSDPEPPGNAPSSSASSSEPSPSGEYEPGPAFPYFEMAILFFASLVSALPLTGLFPYVAYMVVDLHEAPSVDHAGFVSGYVASAFMLGRLVSSFYWGTLPSR